MGKRDTGPPSTGPDEKDVLVGFLDYLRTAIAAKAEGAPEPQARTAGVSSGTNLLGLIKHLTHVERYWLLGEAVTKWKATFHLAPDDTADAILAAYRKTNTEANDEIMSWDNLTDPGARRGSSRRWTLVHMIEETARHAGHADILRELIDGSVGR
ncbi:mini-circle protein [Kibdelosporangium aridum]|uniref:Mini-circle protein n=1 Tax=Kibdelosporangium aridum TaxID=2030 RepID=A0A428ZUL7_KIBAR|nr:DinB family protein [Kibdelosporangium aridum]RSM91758.1 mini-circle protein [Kibdelosporangium aridum]